MEPPAHPGAGNSDLIAVTGALTLPTSGSIRLNLESNGNAGGLGSIGNGKYRLFTFGSLTNAFSASAFSIGTSPLSGGTYTFIKNGSEIDLVIAGASLGGGIGSSGVVGTTGNLDGLAGLNVGKTYIDSVNLNGPALTISGVTFGASSGGLPSGTGNSGTSWSIGGANTAFNGGGTAATFGGQFATLCNLFVYNGSPMQTDDAVRADTRTNLHLYRV